MDYFFEQNVINENIDKKQLRTRVLNILRYVFVGFGILFVLFSFIMPSNQEEVWITFLIFLLSSLPFFAGYIIITSLIGKLNTEYDYVIEGNLLKIIAIRQRRTRKLKYTVYLNAIESVGLYGSDAYKRYDADKSRKQIVALCSVKEEKIVYIAFTSVNDNIKYLFHFEPSQEFMIVLRQSIGRFTVFDKSLNTFKSAVTQ